jgi:8-oxo-dGTP pyrophosphatase MutT (NUDIX family)
MIKPWPRIDSKPAGDYRIFTIRSDIKVSPRTQRSHDFYIIDCVDWVNVVAVTAQQQLVMVEQYRHGSNTVELEIPGGMMDAEDETPVSCGVRELQEETGYQGENAQTIGSVYPNPAIMSNTCHTVLVENCRCLHPTQFDHGEDMITRLVAWDEIPGLIAGGKIRHSLVVAALYYYDLRRRSET